MGKKLGIDRSVLSKLLTGARAPTSRHRVQIARYFGLKQSDFDLPKNAFLDVIENIVAKSDLVFLRFRTTKQNMQRYEQVVARYGGQYLIYYPQTDDGSVIASLLTIGRETKEGIEVSLINPHRDLSGKVTAYEYAGYMYPVEEFFYLYLEQKPADYEILSMIFHQSRTPQVNILKGIISGVGVLDELSFIAARPIIALRRQQNIDDWQTALGTELGYIPAGKVPEIARKQLSPEKITVRLIEKPRLESQKP